ncbi:MAG: YcaO-like family protein [Wolinella sp.]
MGLSSLKGKDAPLEITLERTKKILKESGFEIIERDIENPIGSIFSVFIHDKNHADLFSNGKGYSPKAALVSAYAEFVERTFSGFFFQDYYLGNGEEILFSKDEVWVSIEDAPKVFETTEHQFYRDIPGFSWENLLDFNSNRDEILAQPYRHIGNNTQAPILFPRALLHNLYASNGIAAGNTLNEALVQAISEIIERAVRFRIISEGICLPEIPQKVLDGFSKITEAIQELKAFGYRISIRDASLGGRFPVVAAILINPKDAGAMMIFGAHPNFEIALSRTVSELMQGRALGDFKMLDILSLELEECAESTNLESHFINSTGKIPWRVIGEKPDFDFTSFTCEDSRESELESLQKCLKNTGVELFYREELRGEFSVVRVIAPNFSEIYPLQDLVYSNMNEGRFYRDVILHWHKIEKDELEWLFDEILQLDENRELEEFLGVKIDGYFTGAKLGELQLLLALHIGEIKQALEGAQWAIDTLPRSNTRWLDYALLEKLIIDKNLEVEGVFPYENIARVKSWLNGVREAIKIDTSKARLAQRIMR